MSFYLYRKSHCGDKMILRPSYLHNGISYTYKMTSLYWIGARNFSPPHAWCRVIPVFCSIYRSNGPHLSPFDTDGAGKTTLNIFISSITPTSSRITFHHCSQFMFGRFWWNAFPLNLWEKRERVFWKKNIERSSFHKKHSQYLDMCAYLTHWGREEIDFTEVCSWGSN